MGGTVKAKWGDWKINCQRQFDDLGTAGTGADMGQAPQAERHELPRPHPLKSAFNIYDLREMLAK